MGLRLGLRLSTAAAKTPDTARPRCYGFIVGREPDDKRRWLVRFDDDNCVRPVDVSALTPEVLGEVHGMPSFDPGALPADELHDGRFLPERPERTESLFDFDAQRHDFRSWFLDDVVRPTALAQSLTLTSLSLPAECQAPGRLGAAPVPEQDIDEAARLLSNLHRTALAGQRAAEIAAIAAPAPATVATTGVAIPLTALEAATAKSASRTDKGTQSQNRLRPSHTCLHRMYGNTLRATAKSDGTCPPPALSISLFCSVTE